MVNQQIEELTAERNQLRNHLAESERSERCLLDQIKTLQTQLDDANEEIACIKENAHDVRFLKSCLKG